MYEVDSNYEIWEDGYLKYVTVVEDNVPCWYAITYDEIGAYFEIKGEREYVLVSD